MNFPKKEKIVSFIKNCKATVLRTAGRCASSVLENAAKAIERCTPCLESFAATLIASFVKLRGYRLKTVAAMLVFALCLSVPMVAYAVEFTSAVEVVHQDRSYGFVASLNDAEQVKETVRTSIYGDFDAEQFSFNETSVNKDKITDVGSLSAKVIENAEGVRSACGMYVDGVLKAITHDFAEMNSLLSKGIEYYTAEGATFVRFANSIVLRDIHVTESYAEGLAPTEDGIIDGSYGVQFKTARVENYECEIAFAKTVEYDNNKKTSYSKVKQKGKNGIKAVSANVSYINGEPIGSEEISSTVIKEPVEQITVKGTKKTPVYHSGYVLATKIMTGKAEMVFPVDCNGSTYITSFWGDGRGHKGLDISAPKNTNIYAAADGVVSYAGFRSDYGYIIVVDHNDGKTQTVYSHNRKNLVSKGDTVKAGQHIAEVGATGNATGNHLHFEVRINGTAVDAAPYVGLK